MWLRKIFSVLLCLWILIILPISILVFTIRYSVLSPRFYKSTLREAEVFQQVLEGSLVGFVEKLSSDENVRPYLNTLPFSDQELADALEEALSPEWVQTQFDDVLDGVFAFVRGRSPTVDVVIDISEIQDTLANELIETARQEHGVSMSRETLIGEGSLFYLGEDTKIDLNKTLNYEEGSALLQLPQYYNYVRLALGVAVLVVLLPLLWLAFLWRKNKVAALRWVAIPTFLGSSLTLIVGLAGSIVPIDIAPLLGITPEAVAESGVLGTILTALAGTLIANLAQTLLTVSIIATISAVAIFIGSYVLKRKLGSATGPVSQPRPKKDKAPPKPRRTKTKKSLVKK